MPCYCDTPDSSDQVTIQRRARDRMYFEAIDVIRSDESLLDEAMLNDIKSIPLGENGEVNEKLCAICKILSEENMKKISAYYYEIEWPFRSLFDWHLQHCKDDKENNSVEK